MTCGSETVDGNVPYAVGDRVIIREAGLMNGSVGTVRGTRQANTCSQVRARSYNGGDMNEDQDQRIAEDEGEPRGVEAEERDIERLEERTEHANR